VLLSSDVGAVRARRILRSVIAEEVRGSQPDAADTRAVERV